MKMATSNQSRVACASTRRQGFTRSARRLTPPLTAAAAPAQSAISSCLTQLLRSSIPTDLAAKFLVDPAILNQRLFNPSVHVFGATSEVLSANRNNTRPFSSQAFSQRRRKRDR
jgi:hypothetical protein